MTAPIRRSVGEPLRVGLSASEYWLAEDRGLIKCWELGRETAEKSPELAARARHGELPVLTWKGGVERELTNPVKFGTFRYLATWQGMRGDDLNIDTTVEIEITCSRTGMKVIYTPDRTKYSAPQFPNP